MAPQLLFKARGFNSVYEAIAEEGIPESTKQRCEMYQLSPS